MITEIWRRGSFLVHMYFQNAFLATSLLVSHNTIETCQSFVFRSGTYVSLTQFFSPPIKLTIVDQIIKSLGQNQINRTVRKSTFMTSNEGGKTWQSCSFNYWNISPHCFYDFRNINWVFVNNMKGRKVWELYSVCTSNFEKLVVCLLLETSNTKTGLAL